MARRESRLPEYRLGDAVLETMRGALRILGGTVQMAVGMTRMLAGAVLKVAAVAEKAVGASEEDEELRIRSRTHREPEDLLPVEQRPRRLGARRTIDGAGPPSPGCAVANGRRAGTSTTSITTRSRRPKAGGS